MKFTNISAVDALVTCLKNIVAGTGEGSRP